MAFSYSKLLSLLPRVIMNILPGAMLSGGRVSRVLNAAANRRLPGSAFTYPGLTDEFIYPVVHVDQDVPFMNASLNREIASRGALAQSLEEHNEALMRGGEKLEKALESWWPNEDRKPREDFTPGSSAISGVKILPNNKIAVQWKNRGKWYTYLGGSNPRETSEFAKELLTAPSIGRAVAARTGKKNPDGTKTINPNFGWFGRAHYDANHG